MTPRRSTVIVCSVVLGCLGGGAAGAGATGSPSVPDARPSPYRMVSVDDRGRPAEDGAYGASVSRDGRWVAFGSRSENLDRRPRHGLPQVFLRDNRTGRVRVASLDRRGPTWPTSRSTCASGDGRTAVFASSSEVLTGREPGTDATLQLFMRRVR